MALAKKDKIWICIVAVVTVIVLAITITLGILLRPANEGTNDNGAIDSEQPNNEPTYYEEALNFQGYNKKASDLLVNKWKQNELWKNIDFSNDSAPDIVKNAINNTSLATQSVSFVVTESELFADEESNFAVWEFKNKSSYLSGVADGMIYKQTISSPQYVRIFDSNGAQFIGEFGYAVRSFNNGQTQTGYRSRFQAGAKHDSPITVPAGALANWNKLTIEQAGYASDDTAAVAVMDWTRYRGGLREGNKVKDPVTKNFVETIMLSNGERIPIGGPYTYQIDDTVIDTEASKASVENHGDYYTVKLVYKDEPANPQYLDGFGNPLYDSVIDQACRYAASSLALDILSSEILAIDTIRYSALSMTYEIWNNGLVKSMKRTETMTAYITALRSYDFHCGTNNTAYEVYSYDDRDTIDYITAMYKEAGATK